LTDWFEEVPETHIPQQLGSNTLGNTINDLGAIFGWIDMHTKRTRIEGHINDLHDGLRNVQHICVR
jgi:hypothetical protein